MSIYFFRNIRNEKDKRDSQFSEAPYLGSTKFGILLQKKEKINKKYLDISILQTSPARAGHSSIFVFDWTGKNQK